MRTIVAALAFALLPGQAGMPPVDRLTQTLAVTQAAEVTVTIRAACARCSWGAAGREAVALRLSVDGRYSQHLMLVRGEDAADYDVSLGTLAAGRHQLTIERDPDLSAAGAGPATIEVRRRSEIFVSAGNDHAAASMSPILYARPNTIGRFTDVPLLMWYESERTALGRRIRYSVVFSNEDGGTATDRLMATWGRTTDIEFVYGVELDADGRVAREEFQGTGHEVPPFHGQHEGHHPLLWVSTDNNMVSESGPTQIRYAPALEHVELPDVSREIVMDRHPWTYTVAALEMSREGKIVEDAKPGSGVIPDPRRFVHVEACAELENASLAFAVRAADATGAVRWYESDRGVPEFRIVRTGCFRGAVPLPASAGPPDAIRFRGYSRRPKDAPEARGSIVLTRVNKVFGLGSQFQPNDSWFSWRGPATLRLDGEALELPFRAP